MITTALIVTALTLALLKRSPRLRFRPSRLLRPHVIWAMLNHANVAPRLAFLEGVLITPRLHRVHHVPETSTCNLGTVLTLWDRLRGTLLVASRPPDCVFGVPGEVASYPHGWTRQLIEPARRLLTACPPAIPAAEVSPATSTP